MSVNWVKKQSVHAAEYHGAMEMMVWLCQAWEILGRHAQLLLTEKKLTEQCGRSDSFFCRKKNKITREFPDGTVDKNLPANIGDTGLIPGLGRFHVTRSN